MLDAKKIKMVTFDLDGTIIDDEWAHEQAKTEIAGSFGAEGDLELSRFTGRSNRLFWENVCRSCGANEDIEALVDRQFKRVMELILETGQPESPGLTETMKYLKENGYTIALTSGSDVGFVDSIIDYLNIREYVDVKVTKDHVKKVKPDPDVYLTAQRMAGFRDCECVGVEDSLSGCTALRAAGMVSVGYTNLGKNPQDLSLADHRIQVMTDIIPLLEAMNRT